MSDTDTKVSADAPVAPAPVAADDKPVVLTADEKQAAQVKKLTDDERKAADKEAADAKMKAQKEFHANCIKLEQEHHKASADKLWLGSREIKIVRDAAPDDIGDIPGEACSVVQFMDNLAEIVVQDKDIKTQPVL